MRDEDDDDDEDEMVKRHDTGTNDSFAMSGMGRYNRSTGRQTDVWRAFRSARLLIKMWSHPRARTVTGVCSFLPFSFFPFSLLLAVSILSTSARFLVDPIINRFHENVQHHFTDPPHLINVSSRIHINMDIPKYRYFLSLSGNVFKRKDSSTDDNKIVVIVYRC